VAEWLARWIVIERFSVLKQETKPRMNFSNVLTNGMLKVVLYFY